jgi:sec-independent protein translocase protein TatA
MPNIGWPEIIIVLVILLVIFGPKRLPHLGKSIGQSVRGFKSGMSGEEEEKEKIPAPPAQLNQAQATAPGQPVQQAQPIQQAAQVAPPQEAAQPTATTQSMPEPVPVAPEPPAAVPPAVQAPEPGGRSATQV